MIYPSRAAAVDKGLSKMLRLSRRDRRVAGCYARCVWYNQYRLTRLGWAAVYGYLYPERRADVALRDLLDTDAYLSGRIAAPSCPFQGAR